MPIRLLGPNDSDQLEAFLQRHAATSMFLRSNLRAVGIEDHGKIYQATYLGAFRGNALTGVIAHCWNAMLLPQIPEPDDLRPLLATLLGSSSVAQRGISGASGACDQVRATIDALSIDGAFVRIDTAKVFLRSI